MVGLFILDGLHAIFNPKWIGLYRDDGLAVTRRTAGRHVENTKKRMHAFMKSIGLKIEIEAPLLETDFLDIAFDLRDHKYAPYRKPNNQLRYVHTQSNHPDTIVRQIPGMIGRRISKRSSGIEEFEKSSEAYNKALKDGGYSENIKYDATDVDRSTREKKRNRRRKTIWFNPPFCKTVATNLKRKFINLVRKHFTKDNPLSKLFNKNNMKISYSCMPNMKTAINAHNKHILNNNTTITPPKCNCTKLPCPTEPVPCTTENVLYQAKVTSGNEASYYIGSAATSFKTRWNNHKSSFKYQTYRNATELSKHVWSLKDEGKPWNIEWSIIKRLKPVKPTSDPCILCQSEAYAILRRQGKCLNKRTEIMGKCRHQASGKLVNWLKKPARLKSK